VGAESVKVLADPNLSVAPGSMPDPSTFTVKINHLTETVLRCSPDLKRANLAICATDPLVLTAPSASAASGFDTFVLVVLLLFVLIGAQV
jgi:hypothetical protein